MTLRYLCVALSLRGVALGGRFLFIVFAVKYMLPQEFGRFGLLAALTLIIPVIVGLEAYQILLRLIVQEPQKASETRRFYAAFVLSGSLVSGAIGGLTLAGFGWSAAQSSLGAAILLFEHVGLETCRNLVNEGRPLLSILSMAMRTGAWGVAIPAMSLFDFISTPWSLNTVLYFWVVGSIAAVLTSMPIWHLFRPVSQKPNLRLGLSLLKRLTRQPTWIVYQANLRLIETGGRFVCAWMLSEAVAGRFTFLSMFGSLSYIAVKSVIEPIYYPRLTALETTDKTFGEFRRMNSATVIVATLCSAIALAASIRVNGVTPSTAELVSFILLCVAFGCLSLAQPAHFKLYRLHKDHIIMTSAIAGGAVMVITSVAATWLWGIAGTAAGTMLGALTLLVSKVRAAREFEPGPVRA